MRGASSAGQRPGIPSPRTVALPTGRRAVPGPGVPPVPRAGGDFAGAAEEIADLLQCLCSP
eukprot:5206622-Alexandrium_andersonii.AAC.1